MAILPPSRTAGSAASSGPAGEFLTSRARKVLAVLLIGGLLPLAAVWPVWMAAAAPPAGNLLEEITGTPAPVLSPTVTEIISTTPAVTAPVLITATPELPGLTPEIIEVITPSPEETVPVVITVTLPLTATDENKSGPVRAATPPLPILIGEVLYEGLSPREGDEFVELCNPGDGPVDLTGYKVGDESRPGGSESMYQFPPGFVLPADSCLIIAKNADQFLARFGLPPNFELEVGAPDYTDNLRVPNMTRYRTWSSGDWSLSNTGDEVLVLGPADEILDSVAYGRGDYSGLGLAPEAWARRPDSLQRIWPADTDSMTHDFVQAAPSPKLMLRLPAPPASPPLPANLPDGMKAYWGQLHAHTSYSDGAGPPFYALAMARAAGLHFYAVTDPGRLLSPAEWSSLLAEGSAATSAGQFVALPGVEWDSGPAGHISVFNGGAPLDCTDPALDTLPELYAWLAAQPAAVAQFNHPDSGTIFDSFSFNPAVMPQLALQEIGYSAGARSRYEAAYIQSLVRGWHVAPTFNTAGRANWGADDSVRTGLVASALTEANLLEALRARRVFATEDSNLALALRLNGAWMGSSLAVTGPLPLSLNVVDPDLESLTLFLYDRNLLLATVPLAASTDQWETVVNARPGHYFWVKAVQADGDTAYSAPVWIAGQAPPEPLVLNELLPAPRHKDWDGNGTADAEDEWIEIFNPENQPFGLGGWQLADAAGHTYQFPLGAAIPAGGFITVYRNQSTILLNNSEETLILTRPDGSVADTFRYTRSPGADGSWCRLPDGEKAWSDTCEPSPGTANWEKAPPGPLAVSIYEAKRLTPRAQVKIKGRVTAPPGVLGERMMYIQDQSAGIMIYLPKDHRLSFNLGDRLEVVGKLRLYYGEFEVAVSKRGDVKFLEPGLPPPPLPIATTSLLEPYEGLLVQLQGQVAPLAGALTLGVDDGTGPARVYLRRSTGIHNPRPSPGVAVTAVGIVSQYSTGTPSRDDYRLLPRYPTDLLIAHEQVPPAGWPATLPETGAWPGSGQ